MKSETNKQNFEIDQNFLEELKSGYIRLNTFTKKEESEEYWKLIHSVNIIKNFNFKDSKFVKDFEENIPKLIENNPELNNLTIETNDELLEFDTKFLKQSLNGKKSLKSLRFRFSSRRKVKKPDLRLLFEGFEGSLIISLSLNFIEINNINFKSISKMKNLQSMTINDCEFTESIYESSFSLKSVYLSFSDQRCLPMNELPYHFIKRLNIGRHLNIYSESKPLDLLKFSDSLKNSNLKMLSLSDIVIFENQDHFKDILNQNLEMVEINGIKYSNIKDFPFFSFLKENSIKELTLNGMTNFKDVDTFLINNQVILEVNIDNIQNNMKILSQGLSKNHSLESLSFQTLSNEDFQYLRKSFMNQTGLKYLNLSFCNLNDDSCSFFTEYLLSNKVLKELVLSNNNIGDQAVKYICDGLQFSKSIQNLNLERNLIQDEGCKQLGNFIKNNKSIEILDFNNNPIENKGLHHISENFMYNSSLTSFSCKSDLIDLEKINEFRNNLFYNLTLKYCNICYEYDEKIEFLMNRNISFKVTMKKINGFYDAKFKYH